KEFPDKSAPFGLDSVRPELLQSCIDAVESIVDVNTANIRILWEHLGEKPPATLDNDTLITVVLKNTDELYRSSNSIGSTGSMEEPAKQKPGRLQMKPNTEVFPGNFFNKAEDDEVTRTLQLLQIQMGTSGLNQIKIELANLVGNLIGENLVHELCHAMFGP